MPGISNFGRYFDEFTLGEVIFHWPGKTVCESDNNLFCLLTMNHHPVHLDESFAKEAHHGKILVVGTYVISLVVGMSVKDISGLAIANLGYDGVRHLNPVFIGDTLYASSKVLEKKLCSKKDRGIVTIEKTAWNQKESPVLSLKRAILVPRVLEGKGDVQ